MGKKTIRRAMGLQRRARVQHPHVCSSRQALRKAQGSAVASCFSSSPATVTFYLWMSSEPPPVPGHTSSRRRQGTGGKAGGGQRSRPLPHKLSPSLGTCSSPGPPGAPQRQADKTQLGEEITLLPAMLQACSERRKEPFKFLHWPCWPAVQYPKGYTKIQGRSDHISERNQ